MATKAVISLALASAVDAFSSAHHGHGFLAGRMQPDVAAHTLAAVEEEWQAQASMFVECSNSTGDVDNDPLVDCQRAPKAFAKSCNKVVSAMVGGSSGDRDNVKEYLDDVCSQDELKAKSVLSNRCQSLADGIASLMTTDSWENRNDFKSDSLCSNMWSQLLEQEQVNMQRDTLKHQQEEQAEAQSVKAAADATAQRAAAQQLAAVRAAAAGEEARKRAEKEAQAKAVTLKAQVKKAKAKAEVEAKTKAAKAEAEVKAKAEAKAKTTAAKAQAEVKAKAKSEAPAKIEQKVEKKVEAKAEKQVEKAPAKKAQTDEKKAQKATVEAKALTEEKPKATVAPLKLVIGHKKA